MEKPQLRVTINSDKFRKPALHFKKYEVYTYAPLGTSEYIKYWTKERDYCTPQMMVIAYQGIFISI